jgi:hypothetical protein
LRKCNEGWTTSRLTWRRELHKLLRATIGGIVPRVITLPDIAAEALGSFLASDTKDRFGASHARLAELIPFAARLALECIGNSDALYHNVEHTMLVTLAGHDIFKGRALLRPSTPTDYANFIVACLAHDIGYVRGVVKGDKNDGYVIDGTGRKISLPRGSSDAALAPYHVERSKPFVLDRVAAVEELDSARIARAIGFTRFPYASPSDDKEDEQEKKGHCYEPQISSGSLATLTI